MSINSETFLNIARTIFDSASISNSDRLSFFESLSAAVGSGRATLVVEPSQREPFARALMMIASALLVPEPPTPPQHSTESEMITPELTRSEFEVWDAEFNPKSRDDLDHEIDLDAPESDSEEEEAVKPPAKADDALDEFIIDKIEEIQ
jgi:hypothetical protein